MLVVVVIAIVFDASPVLALVPYRPHRPHAIGFAYAGDWALRSLQRAHGAKTFCGALFWL